MQGLPGDRLLGACAQDRGAEQTASFRCIQDSSLLLLRSLAQILLRGECPIIQGTSEIATAKPAQAP